MTQETPFWKKILLPLGMLAISLALSLLAAEIVVRMVRPQPRLVITPGGFYTEDPPGRYRLAPGYRGRIYNRVEYDNRIRINGKGLRGAEIGEKTADLSRLLTIGDSFVFGVGVEDSETFTALLPGSLEPPRQAMKGLNAGTPAFGVPDAVGWLSRHGVELEPDLVVLSIFQGNDLVDASPDQEEILIVDGLLVPGQSAGGIKAWLHRHSHLFVMLKGLLEQPGMMPLRARLGLGEPWKVRVLREEFSVYKKSATTELQPAIQATDEALEELVVLAIEHGFDLISVLIPSEIQVDPERWLTGLAGLGLEEQQYDAAIPTRIFAQLLEKHAIPTLDLGPVFAQEVAAGQELYFRLDRHWTTQGHRLAAESIGSFIGHLPGQERDSPDAAAMASPKESQE